MSILRQLNVLGQMRLDVPHIRSFESSIAADFDVVAGRVQAGEKAVVVRGFALANFAAGTAANSVQLTTADGILYNVNASEAGTFLWVPADRDIETLNSATNARVSGSFTAGQVNYVGLDLFRSADSTTSDLVQFLDPNTLLENAKNIPLGRTLDYRIVVSTTPFSASPNLVPIAKIKTDSSNKVGSVAGDVQDARNVLWRLGTGGDFPNRSSSFTWAQNRVESITGTDIFTGGDKAIQSQKDWMDAVMTRLWELGGGENWYSTTADRNVRMVRRSGSVFSSTGDNFEYVGGHLHWQGLRVVFDNSNTTGAYYNLVNDQSGNVTGLTNLVNGECIYVDLDRTANSAVTAQKTTLQLLSAPATPGSRFVLAWMMGGDIFTRDASLPVNVSFQPATTTVVGAVRLSHVPQTAGTPTVFTLDSTNSLVVGTAPYAITGSNPGATITGGGTGYGAVIIGGATGPGISVTGNSSANGGVIAAAGAGTGLVVTSASGPGATIATASGGSSGLQVTSQSGYGVNAISSLGTAIRAQAGGASGRGIEATGSGTGAAGYFVGGLTGRGVDVYATAGSGNWAAAVSQSGAGSGLVVTVDSVFSGFNGGTGGSFLAANGGTAAAAAATNGGVGLIATGGTGSYTTIGGAGGNGATVVGGNAGDAHGAGTIAGAAGLGIDAIGGEGGSVGAGTPTAGGIGGRFQGGVGGYFGSLYASGGDGVYATGGTGGIQGGGAGVRGYGGASTSASGGGGAGGIFNGAAHTATPGMGIYASGGAATNTGTGGAGSTLIGGNGFNAGSGGNAITATGGVGGNSAGTGGMGILSTGGAGGTAGAGGDGVKGVGGSSVSTGAGRGGYFLGGTSSSGSSGVGVYAQGGPGNYGAWIVGGTAGAGLSVSPGTGAGNGLVVQNNSNAGHAILVNGGAPGHAMAITNDMNISYVNGRTMKHILGGGSFKAVLSPDNGPSYWGPAVDANTLGATGSGVTTQLQLYHQFTLPQNAVVTMVRVALSHSGATGGATCSMAFQKMTRSDTVNSAPFGWAKTPILTAGSISLSLSLAAVGEVFVPTLNATPSNRTVSSQNDVLAIEFNSNVPAAGNLRLIWVEITYLMYDTLNTN